VRRALRHQESRTAMLDWLIRDSNLLGLTFQNWIPVFVGGLLLYIFVLIIARRWSGAR
jgi:hypothetical protein